ncbi:hypothetical protein [Kitasatospora sp. NPDC048538]|uniref:hypothetical protein n=1 Tax=unclassified Kitasatospora TaxID=2633591 RepID=UPI0033F99EFC
MSSLNPPPQGKMPSSEKGGFPPMSARRSFVTFGLLHTEFCRFPATSIQSVAAPAGLDKATTAPIAIDAATETDVARLPRFSVLNTDLSAFDLPAGRTASGAGPAAGRSAGGGVPVCAAPDPSPECDQLTDGTSMEMRVMPEILFLIACR